MLVTFSRVGRRGLKVKNLSVPIKKSSTPRPAKPKSAKKDDDSSETCSNIVPFEGGLPSIGNIALENSPPPSVRTHSSRCPTTGKSRPTALRPSIDAPPSSSKRKTSPPPTSAIAERRVYYL